MGLNWSAILYPEIAANREEVARLAQSIRTSVIQIHSNVRTVSLSLHQENAKFNVLPHIDENLTYEATFANINALLEQWKGVTKELEMDPSISQEIKQLMSKFEEATSVGQFPDTVRDITSDPAIGGEVTQAVSSLIVGSIAYFFIKMQLAIVIASTIAVVGAAALAAIIIGAIVAVVVGIIIGVIQERREREPVENLRREYEAMDRQLREQLEDLESGVASVQRAILRALP